MGYDDLSFNGIRTCRNREFGLLRDLILRTSGIELSDQKKALLVSRLQRRLRALGLTSYGAYYRRVLEDPAELSRMLNRITTNETSFFRGSGQFRFLNEDVLPAWREEAQRGRRPYRIRAWSAGCSSGEEAYSLAMTLLEHFPAREGWKLEILATDLCEDVLETGSAGIYPMSDASGIPEEYLGKYMLAGRGSYSEKMMVGSELRACIRFGQLNLNSESYDIAGPFDLLLCRNVLIYFEQAAKHRVVERLLQMLAPNGLFFVGHAESLHYENSRLRCVMPNVYSRRSETERPGGQDLP